MGNSIVGSEEQFMMLFKFEYLKGSYASFKKLLEQCQLSYEHIRDDLHTNEQAKAFEFLYNLVSCAHKELVSQINALQDHYSELDGFSESISPEINAILDDLDEKLGQMGPVMDTLLDTRMQNKSWKGFSKTMQDFLHKFGLW